MVIAATNVENNSANLTFDFDITKRTSKFCVRSYIDGFRTGKEYIEFGDAVDEYNRLSKMIDEKKGTNDIAKKIESAIIEYCESNYFDKTEDGDYEYKLYADYRDGLDAKSVTKILESEDPMQGFYEVVEDVWFDCSIKTEDEHIDNIKEILESEDGLFPNGMDDEMEELLKDTFREIARIALPYEHYLKQDFHTNIMVDTGDGNYDYVLNSVYPAYSGRRGETIDDKASIVWLAKQQGYSKTQLKNALSLGDMREPEGFLQSLRVEVANESTSMNMLVFLARMTLEELIEINKLVKLQDRNGRKYDARERPYCGYILIDKETETGLFDSWSGGGSLFEIELEKDVRLPIRYIRSALPDGGDGYSLDEVYGMCGSCWREDVVKKIHAPRNYEELMV